MNPCNDAERQDPPPLWFTRNMPGYVTGNAALLAIFWDAHTRFDTVQGAFQGTLEEVSDFVLRVVESGADIYRRDLRRGTHSLSALLEGHKDALPDPLSSVVLDITARALDVRAPFVLPLLRSGNAEYAGMYVRKLAARSLRTLGLDVDCSCIMRTCASRAALDELVRSARASTPPLSLPAGQAVVFEPGDPAVCASEPPGKMGMQRAAALLLPSLPIHRLLGPRKGGHRVVAAGGFGLSLAFLMAHHRTCKCEDADLYVVGARTAEEFQTAVRDLMADTISLALGGVSDDLTPVVVTRSCQTLTVCVGPVLVQVSLRMFRTVCDIFLSYDLDCCCFAYDGAGLMMTEGALHALAHRAATIDPWQHTRAVRVRKYAQAKGFRMVVPCCQDLGSLELVKDLVSEPDKPSGLGVSVARHLLNDTWNIAQLVALRFAAPELSDYMASESKSDPSSAAGGVLGGIVGSGGGAVIRTDADFEGYRRMVRKACRCCEVAPIVAAARDIPRDPSGIPEALKEHGGEGCGSIHGLTRPDQLARDPFDRSFYSDGVKTHFYTLTAKALRLTNRRLHEEVAEMRLEREALLLRIAELTPTS